MNAKQQFINKWSNWWIFNKHKEVLNKAFESELNEVIAEESHRVAELTALDGTSIADAVESRHVLPDNVQEALNSGDGIYRP